MKVAGYSDWASCLGALHSVLMFVGFIKKTPVLRLSIYTYSLPLKKNYNGVGD